MNEAYCDGVRNRSPYRDNSGKLLLDIIDMHIFDFLTGEFSSCSKHLLEIAQRANQTRSYVIYFTVIFLSFRTLKNFVVITLKFELCGSTIG